MRYGSSISRDKDSDFKRNYNDVMIVVLRNASQNDDTLSVEPSFSRVVCYSERRARSYVSCDEELKAGSYTVACLAFKQLNNSE